MIFRHSEPFNQTRTSRIAIAFAKNDKAVGCKGIKRALTFLADAYAAFISLSNIAHSISSFFTF